MSTPAGPILVTGANGHLGRRLMRRLGAGSGVRGVVRSERAAEVLRRLPEPARPEIHQVDYADAAQLTEVARGCTGIVHLVGILKQTRSARYEDAHERASEAVARAAAEAGVGRIVYLSILGSRPDSPNACLASKGRAEEILLASPVPTTVLRVPMVLGPGELAAWALRSRVNSTFVPLARGGATLEQPIDGENVVDAILAALSDPSDESRTLDLAGPESLPHRDLLRRAAARVGKRPRIVPVPLFLLRAFAAGAQRWMAEPPLTYAMLGVLEHDDQIDPEPACKALGISLLPLDDTLRRCLEEPAEEA